MELHEKRILAMSAADAAHAVERYVRSHPTSDFNAAMTLRLQPRLKLPNIGTALEATGEIAAVLQLEQTLDATVRLQVTWSGAAGTPFPRFHGTLSLEPSSATTSWLRLDGHYRGMRPTLRLAAPGESALGHRLVVATARLLLATVGSGIGGTEGCAREAP